jgi:hypothetical protein
MDGMKLEPDSDSDNEPVSALCETEFMDMKEEDSPSVNGSDILGITDEVQLNVVLQNTHIHTLCIPVIKMTQKSVACVW